MFDPLFARRSPSSFSERKPPLGLGENGGGWNPMLTSNVVVYPGNHHTLATCFLRVCLFLGESLKWVVPCCTSQTFFPDQWNRKWIRYEAIFYLPGIFWFFSLLMYWNREKKTIRPHEDFSAQAHRINFLPGSLQDWWSPRCRWPTSGWFEGDSDVVTKVTK